MTQGFSLKDQLFNAKKVTYLAKQIKGAYPNFNDVGFCQDIVEQFPHLELKQRIVCIRIALKKYLPSDYLVALAILIRSLPNECDPSLSDNDFGDFIFAPYGDFAAHYGLENPHFEHSLLALKEFTTRFSMEDAIRYFINHDPKTSLKALKKWSQAPHYHVRRLCSEGLRPKLPWSKKISINPQEALPILDALFFDPTRFVTRSVANHLNDISKLDPELVLQTLIRWSKTKKQTEHEFAYLTRHSLRTLVKNGHPESLSLLGFKPQAQFETVDVSLDKNTLTFDEALEIQLAFTPTHSQKLMIDFQLHFPSMTSSPRSKVFKWTSVLVQAQDTKYLSKTLRFKQNLTTRKYLKGNYHIDIQINGEKLARASFQIV